jgi:hypothetical protein
VDAKTGGISLHFNQIDNEWGETQKAPLQTLNANPVNLSSNNNSEPSTTNVAIEYMPAMLGGGYLVCRNHWE